MQHAARPVRWIAGLAAASLIATAGIAVLTAGPASAGEVAVSSAQAKWGVKESWRSYVGNAGGVVTVADGASFDGATQASPYLWPSAVDGGTYDEVAGTGTIHLAGTVHYSYTAHFIDLALANPTVVLAGHGTGSLLADTTYDYTGYNATSLDQDQLKLADLVVPTPTSTYDGTKVTESFTNITVKLTAAGKAAFAGFYGTGTVIDPLSLTFAHLTSKVPSSTKLTLAPTTVAYGKTRTATVVVTPAAGGPVATGTVTVREGGTTLRTVALTAGRATVALPATLPVGTHTLTASYVGSTGLFASSTTARVTVVKATASLKAGLAKKKIKKSAKGKVTVKLTATGTTPRGTVRVLEGKKVLRTITLSASGGGSVKLPKLKKGKHTLKVSYLGSTTVGTASKTLTLKVTAS